jgi:signal transduction histidine kinase
MENIATETRFRPPPLLHEHDVVSGMTVVIHDEHRPYGVLGTHTREQRNFTGDDAHFLQAVANVLATSIQRSRAQERALEFQKLAQQRERLADMGAIAAKVVHDLGNPVAAISMQAQLLLRRAARNPNASAGSLTEWAERIVSETQRLDDLVGDFKYFARQQRLDVTTIDLPDFLRTLVGMWQPVAAERGIALVLDIPEGLPALWADEGKLRRVLDNLVKNAVEAINIGPGEIRIEVSLAKPGVVRISVHDSGPGISETIQLFRLFETTKPDGSGLGLPISKEIAHAHGGNLDAERLEPSGTVFHLELPLERHSPI